MAIVLAEVSAPQVLLDVTYASDMIWITGIIYFQSRVCYFHLEYVLLNQS